MSKGNEGSIARLVERAYTKDNQFARIKVCKLIKCFLDGNSTVKEVMAACTMRESATRRWIGALRSAGVLRIVGYEAPLHNPSIIYGLNPDNLPDEPRKRVPKLTGAQRSARYTERKRLAILTGLHKVPSNK